MSSSLRTPSLSVTSAPNQHSSSVEDSPGSSVFDLPVQQLDTPTLERRAHVSPFPPPPSSGLTLLTAAASKAQPADNTRNDQHDPSYLVLSGGTGCNSIVSAFGDACYVLPVSDDGGSSSEIIRVLGGPSIGKLPSAPLLWKDTNVFSAEPRRYSFTASQADSRLCGRITSRADSEPISLQAAC